MACQVAISSSQKGRDTLVDVRHHSSLTTAVALLVTTGMTPAAPLKVIQLCLLQRWKRSRPKDTALLSATFPAPSAHQSLLDLVVELVYATLPPSLSREVVAPVQQHEQRVFSLCYKIVIPAFYYGAVLPEPTSTISLLSSSLFLFFSLIPGGLAHLGLSLALPHGVDAPLRPRRHLHRAGKPHIQTATSKHVILAFSSNHR